MDVLCLGVLFLYVCSVCVPHCGCACRVLYAVVCRVLLFIYRFDCVCVRGRVAATGEARVMFSICEGVVYTAEQNYLPLYRWLPVCIGVIRAEGAQIQQNTNLESHTRYYISTQYI